MCIFGILADVVLGLNLGCWCICMSWFGLLRVGCFVQLLWVYMFDC